MSEEFDKQIKEALSNIEPPYNPASWDDMASRLDAVDDELDQTIIDGLRTVNPSYTPQRWNRLSEWMDYAWYAKNQYFISKSAEAVLMLLALFTFFNYQHHTSQPTTTPMPIAAVNPTNTDETTLASENYQVEPPVSLSNEVDQTATPAEGALAEGALAEVSNTTTNQVDKPRAVKPALNAVNEESNSPTSSTTKLSATALTRTDGVALSSSTNEDQKAPVSTTTTPDAPPVPFRLNQSPIQSSEENKAAMPYLPNASESKEKIKDRPIAMFDPLENMDKDAPLALRKSAVPFAQLASLKPLDRKSQSFDNAPLMKAKRKSFRPWSLSTFTDLSFNSIRTPYDNLYEKSGYNQNRVGVGGGIQVHRKVGPVEVSTGAIYSSKQYNPKEFIELFKKNDESEGTHFIFDGIRLNIVSVPVHASYQVNNTAKWRTYVVAGGAFHMALQAEYERAYFKVNEDQIQGIALQVEQQNGTVTEGRTPNFEKKKFPDGLLGDGSMKDNFYFSIDLGVGLERKLSDATSFFVQPTVYYNLFNKGLSANDDIINTFSLQLGMKTRL